MARSALSGTRRVGEGEEVRTCMHLRPNPDPEGDPMMSVDTQQASAPLTDDELTNTWTGTAG